MKSFIFVTGFAVIALAPPVDAFETMDCTSIELSRGVVETNCTLRRNPFEFYNRMEESSRERDFERDREFRETLRDAAGGVALERRMREWDEFRAREKRKWDEMRKEFSAQDERQKLARNAYEKCMAEKRVEWEKHEKGRPRRIPWHGAPSAQDNPICLRERRAAFEHLWTFGPR